MTSIEREKLPVLLSIRGEQYFDNIDPDATELMTDGTESVTTAFGIGIDSNSSVLELSISPYPFRSYHARLSKSSLQQP